jgi:dTDP-4-dehydrorhamnose 3,5-epimerase
VIVTQTALPGVLVIEPVVHRDARGYFLETWRAGRYRDAGIVLPFVQDNHSHSTLGTLRGLHYQVEQPQGKLVQVITGEAFDVAVDLRRSSPTFGQWLGLVLSAVNNRQLWIPPGFAHGFLVTSDRADVTYKCTEEYVPEHDRALCWNDPELGIAWPLPDGAVPILSAKDAAAPKLRDAQLFP